MSSSVCVKCFDALKEDFMYYSLKNFPPTFIIISISYLSLPPPFSCLINFYGLVLDANVDLMVHKLSSPTLLCYYLALQSSKVLSG